MANSRKNPQPDLALRFAAELTRLLPEQPPLHLCVALSGGLDSVVLLHLLHKTRLAPGLVLSALHVHHGLSEHADEWAGFVQALCADWAIPCHVARVDVALAGDGLEAAARAARYAAFAQSAADVLLLAHHANDQAETVLFNLMRGGGVAGLAGMPQVRMMGRQYLLRPLLNETRKTLVEYAKAQGLSWVEDESNASLAFSRNHLRHEILPALQARYPAAVATLARNARHLAEADALLEELAQQDLAHCLSGLAFDLAGARQLSPKRMQHALRYWLRQSGMVLESRTWLALLAMLEARDDAMPALVWRQLAIRRYRDGLYITPAQCQAGPPCELIPVTDHACAIPAWNGELSLLAGGDLSPRWLAQPWSLRPWSGSAQLRLQPGRHRRSLKHLCQEAGIPPWVRETTPLIYCGEQLMAMPGLGVDADFHCAVGEQGWRLVWCCVAA